MTKALDLTGQRFGKLTAVNIVAGSKPRLWNLQCDCGGSTTAATGDLRRGGRKSCSPVCGSALRSHGLSGSKLYSSWSSMKARCTYEKHPRFHRYGGRGISFCVAWSDFEPFRTWAMGAGYSDGLELDRIDNDGNYEPSNCRWVTPEQNANNRGNNIIYEFEGARLSVEQAARKYGHSTRGINYRLSKGMTPDEAIFTPWAGRRRA